jgi:PAS domain S-box-containing protein
MAERLEERSETEEQLRLIVDCIHDYAIYMLDPQGRIQTWSRGAEHVKGYTADEVIGRNFEMFYLPEDVRAGVPRRLLELAAERGTFTEESVHVRKDGSRFSANVAVSAIRNREGVLRGFVNLTHDITAPKRNEERAAFLAEVSQVLAESIEYDVTLQRIARLVVERIADWCAIDLLENNGLSRVTVQHTDPEKVQLAQELREKYPRRADDPELQPVLQERKTLFYPQISREMLRSDAGDEQYVRLTRELGLRSAIITPLVAADRVIGMMTLVTANNRELREDDVKLAEDIAGRAAVAVRNAQLYREARDANRAKDDFLATVSHELRTPMTAILGWAQLLRMETDRAVIAEAARAIERSATVQSQLVNDILDVARIRVGKLRMQFEPTHLAEVVEMAVGTVRLAAQEKNVRLRTEIDRRDIVVQGDPQRLQQVVWNLLSNAIKFTPPEGIVDVALREHEGLAVITVHDTGPGIAPEFRPHLFERFRQAEPTERRSHGGLGLGLSIVRHIVEAHDGRVEAEPGGGGSGATFTVELPLLIRYWQRRDQGGRRTNDDLEDLSGVSVLLVEDDAATMHFLERMFQRTGADLRTATSVDDALAEFHERGPDIVVSDIAMPNRSGYDLVQAIRASGSKVPCIAVTASGIAGDKQRALEAGFDHYLRKPVEPHALVHLVRMAAGRDGNNL